MSAITTSGSIVAAKYDKGILLASDMSICYGSSFKFANVSHFVELTPTCVIGASGEFADFQELSDIIKSTILEEQCKHGGEYMSPSEIHTYIKRIMYHRRSKMKPLVMKIIVAGINPDKTTFLSCTDLYGASWEDDAISTGFAKYLQGIQIDSIAKGPKDAVYNGMKQVFTAVFARHALANGKVEFIDISTEKITRLEPVQIDPNWEVVEANYDE